MFSTVFFENRGGEKDAGTKKSPKKILQKGL
jgi:hypothetical protein